ncbi:diaminopimelate epimerase [Candidatus Babeliales bacterium]|nr:diaminopimelate epimerase [Candidatus Babeliales bacterium]MCF7899767.1 diaminopimelate epimerase [Candidatus Babeliales bacterium]
MLKKFFKFQSLGNDFIIFDLFKRPNFYFQKIIDQNNFTNFIAKICNRNFGVGADCVLMLKTNQVLNLPEVIVFNADGSLGQVCLNGLRCIAHFLYKNYNFISPFNIKMGTKIFECIIDTKEIANLNSLKITNKISEIKYLEKKTLYNIENKNLAGHVVDVGNPHFVIFEKTDLSWLKQNGSKIENHEYFANKTNTEFVWQEKNCEKNIFNMLVYERGCGITLACSSGATATLYTLLNLKKINETEKILLKMPGGQITGWIEEQKVFLQAESFFVFSGELS